MTGVPAELRARIHADYAAVRPLPSPWLRALWCAPFAALALLAAPTYFNVRADAGQLGWFGGWGASLLQVAVGFALIAAALRESVPGRSWRAGAVGLWIVTPIVLAIAVTLASWEASPVILQRAWGMVWVLCLSGSAATALPLVALASVLVARAYPTRPGIAGFLLGLGAGVIADAGWRMFCHFSEPAHVLSAHLGGVVASAIIGSALAVRLRPDGIRPEI
jgi:hypothetical protein